MATAVQMELNLLQQSKFVPVESFYVWYPEIIIVTFIFICTSIAETVIGIMGICSRSECCRIGIP